MFRSKFALVVVGALVASTFTATVGTSAAQAATVTIPAGSTYGCSISGTYDIDDVTGVASNGDTCTGTLTLDPRVISIGDQAFYQSGLLSVSIPDSVTTIGYAAFSTSALRSVVIGDGDTDIGEDAFSQNWFLTSVQIGTGAVRIGNKAFYDNNYPRSPAFDFRGGSGVTKIGDYAFFGAKFTNFTIPDSVSEIGDGAFLNNFYLTSVSIGSGVTTMGTDIFGFDNASYRSVLRHITYCHSVLTVLNYPYPNNVTPICADDPAANATPPQTRELPAGSTLYTMSCDNRVPNGQLASMNVLTGFQTTIGSGTETEGTSDVTKLYAAAVEGEGQGQGCAIGATYNHITNTAYWSNYREGAISGISSQLFTINLATGVSTYVGQLTPSAGAGTSGAGEDGNIMVYGLAIDDLGGMSAFWTGNSDRHWYIGRVDQSSGIIDSSTIHRVGDDNTDDYFRSEGMFNFAFDLHGGGFYTAGQSPANRDNKLHLYKIDPKTGSITGDYPAGDDNAYYNGLAFDSNGVMWGTNGSLLSATLIDWGTPKPNNSLQWIEHITPYDNVWYTFVAPTSGDNGAAAETARRAAAAARNSADAAAAAYKQRELTEILSVIPSIAGLALNLAVLTNYLLVPQKSSSAKQKCVMGSSTKYVKKGTKCPTGYKKK